MWVAFELNSSINLTSKETRATLPELLDSPGLDVLIPIVSPSLASIVETNHCRKSLKKLTRSLSPNVELRCNSKLHGHKILNYYFLNLFKFHEEKTKEKSLQSKRFGNLILIIIKFQLVTFLQELFMVWEAISNTPKKFHLITKQLEVVKFLVFDTLLITRISPPPPHRLIERYSATRKRAKVQVKVSRFTGSYLEIAIANLI